jgi:hypothetical protein
MLSAARIVVVACAALVLACDPSDPVDPDVPQTNNIEISRADGSGIVFAPSVWAWCGPWEPGEISEPTVHVLVGSQTSRWEFRVVRRDVRIGESLSFPNSFIFDEPRGADMFVHDPPNELSTQIANSTGAVIIEHLDCSAGGGIRFTVEATLGSEFGDRPPVTVTGNFSSPWTGPPGS